MASSPLPFLTDDPWVNIASFLDVRSLGRLACAESRFSVPSVPDPAHEHRLSLAEHWTLVEEGARRALEKHEHGRQVPRRGQSWLKVLHAANQLLDPLAWTVHEESVDISGENRSIATGSEGWGSAACGQEMRSAGKYFAEFTLLSGVESPNCENASGPLIGVAHADYDPLTADCPLYGSRLAWTFGPCYGRLHYGCGNFYAGHAADWPGRPDAWEGSRMPWKAVCSKGDKVGLLLDLDGGSLAVYKNGERLGLIVPPGVLTAPLRWVVGVGNGCGAPEDQSVSVEKKHPPEVSAAELAKDVRRWNPRAMQTGGSRHRRSGRERMLSPQSQSFIRTREQLLRHSRGDWTEDDDY